MPLLRWQIAVSKLKKSSKLTGVLKMQYYLDSIFVIYSVQRFILHNNSNPSSPIYSVCFTFLVYLSEFAPSDLFLSSKLKKNLSGKHLRNNNLLYKIESMSTEKIDYTCEKKIMRFFFCNIIFQFKKNSYLFQVGVNLF